MTAPKKPTQNNDPDFDNEPLPRDADSDFGNEPAPPDADLDFDDEPPPPLIHPVLVRQDAEDDPSAGEEPSGPRPGR